MVKKKARTLTPAEYDAILTALPARHRLMVETAIKTGLRWGELIALKPRHLDLIKRTLTVEETIVEVSIKNSPTGQRMLTKPYPKDNEPRTMGVPDDLARPARRLHHHPAPGSATICCSPPATAPRSPATPSAPASGCPPSRPPGSDFNVRVHDLRHAHASWLLAGGSDLKSVMDRMGHAQIPPPRNTSTPSPTPTPS